MHFSKIFEEYVRFKLRGHEKINAKVIPAWHIAQNCTFQTGAKGQIHAGELYAVYLLYVVGIIWSSQPPCKGTAITPHLRLEWERRS